MQKGRVKFFGKVDQDKLVQCYRAADFLVLPSVSRMECFGIVLVEAMACGLPVITTNIPGPSDVVEAGINGFKVQPKDPDALAKTIRLLLSEEKLQERFAKAEKELDYAPQFDIILKNHDLQTACIEAEQLVENFISQR